MRPMRLHLRGFGIFSQPTDIDFGDAELFALTGPTGSGKTTILDGICFALYGAVPRHGEGAVAPIVNQQMNEASVVFKFSFDEVTYTVARRVRRSGSGATTGDASLEREAEVLATGAGAVTTAVANLLGLDFRQFTTCVLLPQGEFARFLNERPAKRQELLGALLDLGLYDTIAGLATGRTKEADGKLAVFTQRLVELGRITETDLESLRTRQKELEALALGVGQSLAQIDTLTQEAIAGRLTLEILSTTRVLLLELTPPPGWTEIGTIGAALRARESSASAQAEAAAKEHSDLAAVVHPARSQIERFLKARTEQASTRAMIGSLATTLNESKAALAVIEESQAGAEAALDAEINSDRASHLRAGLKIGDLCPVCGERLAVLMAPNPGGVLSARRTEVERAASAALSARTALRALESDLARAEGRLRDLEAELEGADTDEALSQQIKAIDEHHVALAAALARLTESRNDAETLHREIAEVNLRLDGVREELNAVWPRLSALEPPLLDLADPVQAWRKVLSWRDERLPALKLKTEEASTRLAACELEVREAETRLSADLEHAGIEPNLSVARDSIAAAQIEIGAAVNRVVQARDEAERVSQASESATAEKNVAKKLAAELAANKFKKWIFDEVFSALVAGANLRLSDLTSGQYELAVTNNDFEVIDHFAADNRRGVRSLSGGETFLVSLALAVALADEVAASAGSHLALDSFFLDEGFGTLDSESLDVVATVITELGAAGKTVGIVTHVEELAEQMPVRYEVRRVGNSATVTQRGLA